MRDLEQLEIKLNPDKQTMSRINFCGFEAHF